MTNLRNLIDFLPFEFKDQDTYKVDGKGILERFLEICGSYYQDKILPDIDNILDIIDLDKTPKQYLTYLWEFLGEIPLARPQSTSRTPNLSETQIRNILKYSISLLKIRGSKQFFEILFRMYGLTCIITDPTDGSMEGWVKVDPQYDGEYSNYDKYHYDRIFGCTQCIPVQVEIRGHGFTSATPEFKAFKQAIDKLFDRFLPYNVSCKVGYGFTLPYNYRIEAKPLIDPPSLISGQVNEVPIRVTVTSDFEDADLRFQVTGYDPSANKWSTKLYPSGHIFYARKGNQTYYFRSVGDTSKVTQVTVGEEYYIKSWHIYSEIVSGGTDLNNLILTSTNKSIKLRLIAYLNYKGDISSIPVQLLETGEIKDSNTVWEITEPGTYTWVIANFPAKKVQVNVTKKEVNYTVLCEPRNINLNYNEKTRITLQSTNPSENVNELFAVLLSDSSVVVANNSEWAPETPGTYQFRCNKDNSGNPNNYGTVIASKSDYKIVYNLKLSSDRVFMAHDNKSTVTVYLTSGIEYSTFKNKQLYKLFNTDVNIYKQSGSTWNKVDTVKLTQEYRDQEGFYGVQLDYQFTSTGLYKFESVGDPGKSSQVNVFEYVVPETAYLWIDLNTSDPNWSNLVTYEGSEGRYTNADYQLTKESPECQFYLRYGNSEKVTDIKLEGSSQLYQTDVLVKLSDPGTYTFSYGGMKVSITVLKRKPVYTLSLDPVSADLKEGVSEVTTVVTCSSDTGDVSDIIYESVPDVAHKSPYQFTTNLPGKHRFYLKDDPKVETTFIVNLMDLLDITALEWAYDDTSVKTFNLKLPDGVPWTITEI